MRHATADECASCFCVMGALFRCGRGECMSLTDVAWEAYDALSATCKRLYDSGNIVQVNDGPDGHARIVRALKETITEVV